MITKFLSVIGAWLISMGALVSPNLGATILETNLSDTIGTFRTNVNTSLNNLNNQLTSTTTTDPGHKHSSSSITGVFGVASGGSGTANPGNYGVLIASGTNAFTTIVPGTAGNVLTSDGTSWVSAIGSAPTSTQIRVMAGQSLQANDAVYIRDVAGTNIAWLAVSSSSDADLAVGMNTPNNVSQCSKCAQSFTATSTEYLSSVQLRLKTSGSPSDNFQIAIQADSSGSPSGTDLATATKAAASLTGSYVSYNLALSQTVTITGGQTYWLVFRRSGALNDTDIYIVGSANTNIYSGGAMYASSSSWTTMTVTVDSQFTNFVTGVLGHAYKTNATATSTSNSFIGFVNGTTNASSTATINVAGGVGGFSGLFSGAQYYLGNATGTISSTTGSVTRKVGISTSPTELLITNNW